jgi:hypothetical protein
MPPEVQDSMSTPTEEEDGEEVDFLVVTPPPIALAPPNVSDPSKMFAPIGQEENGA